jgi:hypothetical protein
MKKGHMAQYIAFAPHVEVNGATVLSITAGMGSAALPILAAHGLAHVVRDQWYSQQAWLDAFQAIASLPGSMSDLVGIGMEIPRNAIFPSEIDSIEAALRSIDVAYHMNHRGGDIGHYQVAVVNDQQIDMICENPYPCDFDFGIIYSMARRFCSPGKVAHVFHDSDAPCRKHGADSCTYHVIWGN